MNSLITIFTTLTLLSIYTYGRCWHGNVVVSSYGHDIIVWDRGDGGLRVVFGEVPRWSVQYPIFYNKTSTLINDDVWSSIAWNKNIKLQDAFPSSFEIMKNLSSSGLMASGYSAICSNGCSISGTGVALLPRLYNVNSSNLGQQEIYIIGMNLRDSMLVDDSVCEGVVKYLSVNRYDVYNNWRFARYSIILFISLLIGLITYYAYPDRISLDRLYRTCFCIISGLLYSVLGIIFISDVGVNTDFQSVEYVYYITISVIYFGSFIRYVSRKVLQDKTASFYHNSLTGGGKGLRALKSNTMETKIITNNILNSLVAKTPRSFTNSVILWIALLLASPGIHIIIHDTLKIVPYPNYVLSITIIKFLVPIITTCIPAIIIFILSMLDYYRRDKRRKMGKYFGISEDPLLYRIEFISCLVLCLPSAIITFVVGNLDGIMPPYILTARWYHLTFHAIFYIIFDVTYLFIISGTLSILMSIKAHYKLSDDLDVRSTTIGAREERRRMQSEVVLELMLNNKDGYYEYIANFAMKTDNYIPLGIREWIMDIDVANNSDADQGIKNLVSYYIDAYSIGKSINNVLYPRGIIQPDSIIGYSDIAGLKQDIIEEMESNLFARLIFDGITETDIYKEFELNNKIAIKEYAGNGSGNKIVQIVIPDEDIELEDPISIDEHDMACSTSSV